MDEGDHGSTVLCFCPTHTTVDRYDHRLVSEKPMELPNQHSRLYRAICVSPNLQLAAPLDVSQMFIFSPLLPVSPSSMCVVFAWSSPRRLFYAFEQDTGLSIPAGKHQLVGVSFSDSSPYMVTTKYFKWTSRISVFTQGINRGYSTGWHHCRLQPRLASLTL